MRIQNRFFRACCACLDTGGIWFVEYSYAILLFFDFSVNKITTSEIIPLSKFVLTASFLGMYIKEDTIYLIPNSSDRIIIYDKKSKCFESVMIHKSCVGLFRDAFVYKENLFCIPNLYDVVIKFDLCLNEVTYLRDLSGELCLPAKYGILDTCTKNQYVYIIIDNQIIVFNMETIRIVTKYRFENAKFTAIDVSSRYLYAFDANKKCIYLLDRLNLNVVRKRKIESDNAKLVCLFDTHLIVESVNTPIRWIYNSHLELLRTEVNERLSKEKYTSNTYYFSKWVKKEDCVCEITVDNRIVFYDPFENRNCYYYNVDEEICEKIWSNALVCRERRGYENIQESGIIDLRTFLSTLIKD